MVLSMGEALGMTVQAVTDHVQEDPHDDVDYNVVRSTVSLVWLLLTPMQVQILRVCASRSRGLLLLLQGSLAEHSWTWSVVVSVRQLLAFAFSRLCG